MKNLLFALTMFAGLSLLTGCDSTPVATGTDAGDATATSKSIVREGEVNTVSFNVPGMTCEGCAAMVGDALAESPGVEAYTVDLEHKIANVKINPDTFKADDALKALVAAGYEDSSLKN